jgi:hypothetical protein
MSATDKLVERTADSPSSGIWPTRSGENATTRPYLDLG